MDGRDRPGHDDGSQGTGATGRYQHRGDPHYRNSEADRGQRQRYLTEQKYHFDGRDHGASAANDAPIDAPNSDMALL